MILLRQLILPAALCLLLSVTAQGQTFELRYEQLRGELNELSSADKDVVSDAIQLIKDGEHALALARLSSLSNQSPHNSSLQILASYTLLQVGNLLGAFEKAKEAHTANHVDPYCCWFLAKVALLNGKKAVCRRELKHLEEQEEMTAEVRQLKNELREN